jgi:3-deoxy-D-manno-octulosonic acid kinase
MLTKIGFTGSRIATATGAVLFDPDTLAGSAGSPAAAGDSAAGDSAAPDVEALFDLEHWRKRGELLAASRGRGAAWFIRTSAGEWVLRRYRRGGAIARWVSADRYWWLGEERVRAFAEWRLLARLWALDLPVPKPIAARYSRRGLSYGCDLLMRRIPDAEPLSAALAESALPAASWSAIGALIARFHAAGVDHADLNAHNILHGKAAELHLIDFDRGRIRADGSWKRGNLQRLRRSLDKIARDLPADRFSNEAWNSLLAGYAHAPRL